MSRVRAWCDVCRGGSDDGELFKCSSCPRKFHEECAKICGKGAFTCPTCANGIESQEDKDNAESAKACVKRVRAMHLHTRSRSCVFYRTEKKRLAPFVPQDRLKKLMDPKKQVKVGAREVPRVNADSVDYIKAELRDYQVQGVNWILSQYEIGVGGIVADEMGLGKTIQTLSFIASLKEAGLGGPHLVITPLAVLQNWQNEIKRFTPGLTSIKVHGSAAERDRILSMPEVICGEYDIYLTTYEMIVTEEAFFTETLAFHTIVIDEGHRLKNDTSKLTASLARIGAPFRLLLTGTPLQNNLNELWSLLHYILPEALRDCRARFEEACSVSDGQLDKKTIAQARALLETLMIRRVKAEVEKSLKPKIQYVLKVPLAPLQRQWYRRFMEKSNDLHGLNTREQIIRVMSNLQKAINHPKTIIYDVERQRKQALLLTKRAEGAEFFMVPECLKEQSAATRALEQELLSLQGRALVAASGKLQVLDRLLTRVLAEGSRVLVFSQFTLTLDILQEYCAARFGPEGQGFLRLDGSTNRIKREMEVRAFNAPQSKVPVYLISTKAGGQGINLATADVVCLYDTSWNPQVDLQAQDRSHRIGQKKQVRVFRLIAEHTFEERILARARQRLVLDAMVLQKKGMSSAIRTELSTNNDASDEAEMAKLSLEKLWKLLVCGADQLHDPTFAHRPPLTDADLDTIIQEGRIITDELDEEEQAELEKEGEDAWESSLWHEDCEAAKQLMEEEDEMAVVGWSGVGTKVRALLKEASEEDLHEYLTENNEALPKKTKRRALMARVVLHLRGRGIRLDGNNPFDLRTNVLRALCLKNGIEVTSDHALLSNLADHGDTDQRGELLKALVEHMLFVSSGAEIESSEQKKGVDDAEKTAMCVERGDSRGGISCKIHRQGAKSCKLQQKEASRDAPDLGGEGEEQGGIPSRPRNVGAFLSPKAKPQEAAVRRSTRTSQSGQGESKRTKDLESAEHCVRKRGRQRDGKERHDDKQEEGEKDEMDFVNRLVYAFEEDKLQKSADVPAPKSASPVAQSAAVVEDNGMKEQSETTLMCEGEVVKDVKKRARPAGESRIGPENGITSSSDASSSREGRRRSAPKRFCPPSWQNSSGPKRQILSENECFNCNDGGELLECSVCPKVYHPTEDCAGLKGGKIPQGAWYCPWHRCFTCDRSSSQAGGMLFHCQACPTTFCFECCPDEYKDQPSRTKEHELVAKDLEEKGMTNLQSWLFFTCEDCVPVVEERRKLREEQERQRQERLREIAAARERQEQERVEAERRRQQAIYQLQELRRQQFEREQQERQRQMEAQRQLLHVHQMQQMQMPRPVLVRTDHTAELTQTPPCAEKSQEQEKQHLQQRLQERLQEKQRLQQSGAQAKENGQDVGGGWKKFIDCRMYKNTYGKAFYYHEASKLTQWEFPSPAQLEAASVSVPKGAQQNHLPGHAGFQSQYDSTSSAPSLLGGQRNEAVSAGGVSGFAAATPASNTVDPRMAALLGVPKHTVTTIPQTSVLGGGVKVLMSAPAARVDTSLRVGCEVVQREMTSEHMVENRAKESCDEVGARETEQGAVRLQTSHRECLEEIFEVLGPADGKVGRVDTVHARTGAATEPVGGGASSSKGVNSPQQSWSLLQRANKGRSATVAECHSAVAECHSAIAKCLPVQAEAAVLRDVRQNDLRVDESGAVSAVSGQSTATSRGGANRGGLSSRQDSHTVEANKEGEKDNFRAALVARLQSRAEAQQLQQPSTQELKTEQATNEGQQHLQLEQMKCWPRPVAELIDKIASAISKDRLEQQQQEKQNLTTKEQFSASASATTVTRKQGQEVLDAHCRLSVEAEIARRIRCGNGCEGDDAAPTHVCRECASAICAFCVTEHRRQRHSKLHELIDIAQLRREQVATAFKHTEEDKMRPAQRMAEAEASKESKKAVVVINADDTEDEEEEGIDSGRKADGAGEAGEEDEDSEDDTACEICGGTDDGDKMILCDDCDKGYHLHCLNPPLESVPEGDWRCGSCLREGPIRRRKRGRPPKKPAVSPPFADGKERKKGKKKNIS